MHAFALFRTFAEPIVMICTLSNIRHDLGFVAIQLIRSLVAIRYVFYLESLHMQAGNKAEAAHTHLLHSAPLRWANTPAQPVILVSCGGCAHPPAALCTTVPSPLGLLYPPGRYAIIPRRD